MSRDSGRTTGIARGSVLLGLMAILIAVMIGLAALELIEKTWTWGLHAALPMMTT